MLFANLGIVAGVYISKRLWDKYTKPKTHLADIDKVELAENTHQSKAGAISVGLVVAGYWYAPFTLLGVVLASYNTAPMIQRSIDALREQKRINNNSYSTVVTLLLLGTGQYFPAVTHNLLYHLSCYFVSKSRTNAQQLTLDAYQQMPDSVWITTTDAVDKQISLDALKKGDAVVVSVGETIPIDGVVQSGMALIDQQALTGEAEPVEKMVGQEVMAATLVLSGRIVVTAAEDGQDTRVSKLNTLLQQTRDYKTGLQMKGEVWANKIALPVMVSSTLLMPVVGVNPALALLFSFPVNTVRAMLSVQTSAHLQWAAKQGVFIKDGRVLEELSQIDVILFDKTGTLTQTQPEVVDVICCAERDEDTLLSLAAAAEQHMEHPIAQAIHAEAVKRSLDIPRVTDSHYDLGLGVSVKVNNYLVQIGSQRFIQQVTNNAEIPGAIHSATQQAAGDTFIYIAIDGVIEGALQLRPCLRPEVPELVRALRERNFAKLGVISGDQQQATARMAAYLDLDEGWGDMLPQDKANYIKELQAQGHHVCFIGDGLNDAIALKQANVSICLSSATPIANDAAQIVLLNDSLVHLDPLFDVTTQLHHSLNKSLKLWIGFGATNALAIPLLAFGPLQSSLFYVVAYSAGLKLSRVVNEDKVKLIKSDQL